MTQQAARRLRDLRDTTRKRSNHSGRLWCGVPLASLLYHAFPEKYFRQSPFWGYLGSVASLVYLTSRSNSKQADELTLAGHRVLEALAVSEALYLCEHNRVDAIVIAPDIDDPDLAEAQLHHITIRMKGSAKDLIWELSRLFPDKAASIQ